MTNLGNGLAREAPELSAADAIKALNVIAAAKNLLSIYGCASCPPRIAAAAALCEAEGATRSRAYAA